MNKLLLKISTFSTILIMLLSLSAAPAFAHRINIFAWLENDKVIVECNFGANRPARNSAINVLDSTDNKVLVHGVTNGKGIFTFSVPSVIRQGHGLIIEVNAGQGHRNVWRMNAAEFYEAASLTAGFDAAAIAAGKENSNNGEDAASASQTPLKPQAERQEPAGTGTTLGAQEGPDTGPKPLTAIEAGQAQENTPPAHVQKIVNEALEAHMAPIKRQLAELSAKGPSIAEIIGGIGWVIGLVGIALYFKSRRRQD